MSNQVVPDVEFWKADDAPLPDMITHAPPQMRHLITVQLMNLVHWALKGYSFTDEQLKEAKRLVHILAETQEECDE